MSKLAYITPDQAPGSFECRGLFIPVGQSWEAILSGALHALTLPESYEQVGGMTAEQTAAVFAQMWLAWDSGKGCPMFEGMIVMGGCAAAPAGWLVCDGTAYNTVDYPALYNAIGDVFGDDGAGTFRVPDLQGRSPLGVGAGAGLTARVMADSGGEEKHWLTEGEMPAHTHNMIYIQEAVSNKWGIRYKTDGSNAFYNSSTYTGGDEEHNTMHPFLAVNFFIYAGQ